MSEENNNRKPEAERRLAPVSLLDGGLSPSKAADFIHSLHGKALDDAIRKYVEPTAKAPSQSLAETWEIADQHNGEGWHKFSVSCDAGVWDATFSNLHPSSFCETAQEAILQALLMDKHSIVRDFETQSGWRLF